LSIEGEPPWPSEEGAGRIVDQVIISPDYFRAIGVPLIEGRAFTEHDMQADSRQVIINATLARQFFAGKDPVGKRLKLGFPEAPVPWLSIVGVVGDVRLRALDEQPRPAIYQPYLQGSPMASAHLAILTTVDPMSIVAAAGAEIRAVDGKEPVYDIGTMEEHLEVSAAPRRFKTLLFGIFAIIALVLAAVGVYGVMSYSVAQPRNWGPHGPGCRLARRGAHHRRRGRDGCGSGCRAGPGWSCLFDAPPWRSALRREANRPWHPCGRSAFSVSDGPPGQLFAGSQSGQCRSAGGASAQLTRFPSGRVLMYRRSQSGAHQVYSLSDVSQWRSTFHKARRDYMKRSRRTVRVVTGVPLAVFGALVLATQATFPQNAKPDFSGHWELDKAKSDFGPGPQPDDVIEVIEHHEPKLVITTTTKQNGAENTRSVRLTTDDVENTNLVAGHVMKTRTHWDGRSLVTVVRDEGGLQLTEVRTLSKDGKTEIVETDFGMGKQKLVLAKK
jgi:hypothetical protein